MTSVLLVTTLGFGCGNSANTAAEIERVCSDAAQVRCAKRSACTSGAEIERTFGDLQTCVAREKLSCELGLQAVDVQRTTDSVASCTAALDATSCFDFLTNVLPPDCVVPGAQPFGAVCSFGGQCESGYCDGNRASACGTCGDPPIADDDCSTRVCAPGYTCVASTAQCEPWGIEGSSCGPTNPCGPDLACLNQQCVPAVTAQDAACVGTLPACDSWIGLHCDGAAGSKTCGQILYVGDGMACGTLTSGHFAACADGGTCYTPTGATQGTCKAAAPDGADCDTALGPPCMYPARCVVTSGSAGVCTTIDGTQCM
jgi:hypothetical protein